MNEKKQVKKSPLTLDDLTLKRTHGEAYTAYRSPDRDEQRFRKLLKTMFSLCEIAGFDLVGRVTLRDKRSGRTWK